jgi:hypothetical protein
VSAELEFWTMSSADVQTAVDWAAEEGWNPGLRDAECFAAVDPEGFIGGYRDGEMVTSISVVNYDDAFAFLGFYIARPDVRGRGYGYATWKAGMAHAGDRQVGLDGVVAQQANYAKSGFNLVYRNIRHGGPAPKADVAVPEDLTLRAASAVPLDVIERYDRHCFPAPRRRFLRCWLDSEGHVARAVTGGNALRGYGVLRPCGTGWKVGPLFADDAAIAEALFLDLARAADGAEIFLDTPETNEAAVDLATRHGLTPVFETARMYTGEAPKVDLGRVFGVTTFELG